MTRDGFERDAKTQKVIEMNLVVIGEAASRVLAHHADVAQRHFEIDLDVVWNAVQTALPALVAQLSALPGEGDWHADPVHRRGLRRCRR